jgi:hypothetical protein
MLNWLDDKWMQGEYLNFRDEGPVSPGSVTHKFSVTSRHTNVLLGYVKWYNQWRQYCFFSTDVVLDVKCLQDIKSFVELATNCHRDQQKTPMRSSI